MSMAAPTIPGGFESFGKWINELFKLWGARWQVWTLQGLIMFGLSVIPAVVTGLVLGFYLGERYSTETGIMAGVYIGTYGAYVILGFVNLLLAPGMVKTALKQMRGEEISVADLFSGAGYFFPYFALLFVISLGAILLCFGAWVTTALFFFTLPIMVDKRVGLGEALSLSWKTVASNFWLVLVYALVIGMIVGTGQSFCCIGLIVTWPWYSIAMAIAYENTYNRNYTAVTGGPLEHMPPPYAPPPTADSGRFCLRCGKPLADTQQTCPECGYDTSAG